MGEALLHGSGEHFAGEALLRIAQAPAQSGAIATGHAGYLRERGMRRLFLAGLDTDYCVLYSALDVRREGFEVVVLLDACRGLNVEVSLAAALTAMHKAGVDIRDSTAS